MNTAEINKQLAESYLDILRNSEIKKIYETSEKLSGIFLPTVPDYYLNSKIKLMLVGKQTRGWLQNWIIQAKSGELTDADIQYAMNEQQNHLLKPPRMSKFKQFYRQVNREICQNNSPSVFWANFFCISDSSKSPCKSTAFQDIKSLSFRLLQTQIDLVKPEIILFTTGTSYDKYLKEFAYQRSDSQCLEPKVLWAFKIDNAQCYRIRHPQYGQGREARQGMLKTIINSAR